MPLTDPSLRSRLPSWESPLAKRKATSPSRRLPCLQSAEIVSRPARSAARRAAWIAFGASFFALAEIALAILVGRYFDWGRAEALLFFAFRPWLLLIAAISLRGWPWQRRFPFYGLALLMAGLSESVLVIALGADNPWPEMLRGLAAGALLAATVDLFIAAGGRIAGTIGSFLSAVLLAAALLVPGSLAPYERILLPEPAPASDKPPVLVITSLPIVWGEMGAFAPGAAPAASWRSLAAEFDLTPIDFVDSQTLGQRGVTLVAQPRQLAPGELVALDQWVRGGGKILILADPLLAWPSGLPLGDVRRPISSNMLTPLLSHWGITFGPSAPGTRMARIGDRQLRIVGSAPLFARGLRCGRQAPFVLDCPIGRGRAIVVADADLLHDSTSLPPGASIGRHSRWSDNVVFIADLLDRLAGLDRSRAGGDVQWADAGYNRARVLIAGLLPIAMGFALALILAMVSNRYSPTYPQGLECAKSGRTNQE